MIYTNNTPIVKDSSELQSPYISVYNQVFVQNEKIKLVIHHEIFPVYIKNKDTADETIIPNEAIFYWIVDNKDTIIACYHSFYKALCEFYKIK